MRKYGKGLGAEFALAIKEGLVNQPFTSYDLKEFALSKGWKPSPHYISVLLANGASKTHSPTYGKYFVSIGNGFYMLSELAK